jgi:subtilisin family serine protease
MASKLNKMLLGVGMAVAALAATAFAADSDFPHKKGDVIVYFKNKGTTANMAQQFASRYGMAYKRALKTPGIFLITIPGADKFSDTDERVRVQQKLDSVRRDMSVKYACLNQIVDKHQVPNDPLFGSNPSEQWNLYQITIPDATGAWSYTLGNPSVLVADLDDGFDFNHPDFLDASNNLRLVDPYNSTTGTTDVNAVGLGIGDFSHGLMTSGVIAAGTDNGKGIAGVTWQGVQLMPVKIGDDIGNLLFEHIFDAYQHVIDYNNNPLNTRKVAVQNMSYGAVFGPNPIENELLQAEADQGVILCASAGNSRPIFPAGYPASLPQVISVAATINGPPKGVHTSYSSAGLADRSRKVDLAAPSSDSGTNDVVTLEFSANSGLDVKGHVGDFGALGGTSYACPEVVGTVALMLSFGFPRNQVFDALKTTGVVAPGDPKPNVDVGWGEVDAAAAMALALPGVISLEPTAGSKFEYQTVHFKFRVHFMATISSVTVTLTGGSGTITVPNTDYTVTVDGDNPTISYVEGNARLKDSVNGANGTWTITCNGVGVDLNPYSGSVVVTVQQRTLLAGTSMFSIPFALDGNDFPAGRLPEQLFSPGFRQFRWIPTLDTFGNPTGSYAEYTPGAGNTDPAGFTPSDAEIIKRTQNGSDPIDTPENGPYGVGWWVITDTDTVFDFERGVEDGVKYYRIKLKPGWNQFGDPYDFPVDWNSCSIVELPSNHLVDMATAVNDGVILPQLFRYEILLDGSKGYTWESVPRGQMQTVQSHWVYAKKECWLQIPPLPGNENGTSANSRLRGDGWLVQLSAKTDGSIDSSNYFGATKNFNPKLDKVGEPPAAPNSVQAWFESGTDKLAQDLRELTNSKETYTVKVRPNKPNERITLNWNYLVNPSKRMRMVLKDEATGKSMVMQQTGSYTLTSDDAMTPRVFTVTASPVIGGRLAIGAIRVAGGGRGIANYSIEYNLTTDANVVVRILSSAGKPVADLVAGSRSAGPNSISWNARDSKGRAVAPGVYMVQITAETTNGERIRRTSPLTVTR